jgi:hypothetical protein
MYDFRPNLIIGFHGCDIRVRDKLLNHPNEIVISQKPYDWLGHGMYFWENNYGRAMQWAKDKMRRGANLNCIQGFFLPRREVEYLPWLESVRDHSAA